MTRLISRLGSAAALSLFGATTALAAGADAVLPSAPDGSVGADGGVTAQSLLSFAATWLLSISGGVAVLFLIMGGLVYMTAGGSDEKVNKGKKYMMNAVIGLVVVLLAFIIVSNTVNLSFKAGGTADSQNGQNGAVTFDTPTVTGGMISIACKANAAPVNCPVPSVSSSNSSLTASVVSPTQSQGSTQIIINVTKSGLPAVSQSGIITITGVGGTPTTTANVTL